MALPGSALSLGDAVAVDVGPGTALRVTTAPAFVVLDKARPKVEVLIDVDEGAEGVRLFTNVGSVGHPTPSTTKGRLRAIYLPPEEFHPQVAILAVSARIKGEVVWAFTSLPLWGRGQVAVKATPGTPVKITLAGRPYGPVKADAAGRARIPVVVPPGVSVAYAGKREVPVGVVPFLRLLIVADAAGLAADADTARVRVFAVDNRGKPMTDAGELRLEIDKGEAAPLIAAPQPGMFTSTIQLPPRAAGSPTLKASVAGNALLHELTLRREAGAPETVELTFSKARHVAGTDAPTVVVNVLDRWGAPVGSGDVVLTARGASLGPRETLEDGSVRVALQVTDAVPPDREIVIEARAAAVVGKDALPFDADVATKVTLEPPPAAVTADGNERALLVRAQDRFGNELAEPRFTGSAEHGEVAPARKDERGRWRLPYRPALRYEAGDDVVRVRSGDVEAELRLPLRAGQRSLSLGLSLGGVTNLAALSAPGAVVDVSYRFANVGVPVLQDMAVGLEVTPLFRLLDAKTIAGDVHTELLLLPVGLTARYHVSVIEDLSGYVSAGGHVVFVNSVVVAAGRSEERFLAGGAAGALGVSWRLGQGSLQGEARLFGVVADEQSTLQGTLFGVGVFVGYRFDVL